MVVRSFLWHPFKPFLGTYPNRFYLPMLLQPSIDKLCLRKRYLSQQIVNAAQFSGSHHPPPSHLQPLRKYSSPAQVLNHLRILPCYDVLYTPTGCISVRAKHTRQRKLTRREKITQDISFRERLVHIQPDVFSTDKANVEDVWEVLVWGGLADAKDQELHDITEVMVNAGCTKEALVELFSQYPQIISSLTAQGWKTWFNNLAIHGFSGKQALEIASRCPNVLELDPDALSETIQTLIAHEGMEDRAREMCIRQPALLTLDASELQERYADLTSIFSQKDLNRILYLNASLLLEDIEENRAKLDYVTSVLGIPEKSLFHCGLFNHSLLHIRTRSEFLIKSGLYIKPDKHGHSPMENPELGAILDTGDSTFCEQVASCEMAEYETYRKLVEKQLEKDFRTRDNWYDEENDG